MKLLIMTLTLFAFNAGAATQIIYSTGRGTGFCAGDGQGWFCYEQIKDRSKQDAIRNAYYSCSANKGHINEYSATCNYFCTPFSVPQGEPTQFVQCSSNCNMECVTPK